MLRDRRRIELQIRAVIVPFRVEVRRRDAPTIEELRKRGRALLAGLDEAVRPYPDLAERLREARHEVDGVTSSPGQPAEDEGSDSAPEGRPRSPGG